MQITVAMVEKFLDNLPHLERYREDIISSARAAVDDSGNIPMEKLDGVMGFLVSDFFDFCCRLESGGSTIVGEDEIASI